MFSNDPKHYRATPRTTGEAFGPYHNFAPSGRRKSRLWTALGVVACGAVLGLLVGWRG